MAANFQPQMNNGGQMMMQQQQRGQQAQQRPQQGNQNMISAQIQQLIFNNLHDSTGPLEGWQANVMMPERIGMVFNLVGNLRLASQSQQNGPSVHKMVEIGLKFEKEIFERSPDYDHYKHEIQMKLDQLLERRNQNMQGLQQSINDQARAQAQAQQAAAQQQMMNQNGMQGQMTRPQPAQQGFHHLQQQMTASPIPGQGIQQPGGGMPNQGMSQNMTASQQQQFQMSMQQPGQQNPQNGLGRPPNGQPPNMQQSQQEAIVTQLGHKLMAQASEQERNQMRVNLQGRMDASVLQGYAAKGIDPLFLYYRNQAIQRLGAQRRAHQHQQQQQQAQQAQQAQAQSHVAQQQVQNNPATAPQMAQQRSTNRSPMNGQTQPPTSSGGNVEFFVGNMIDQQQQGVMAEQAGQTVVPMSNAQRNATPQPGLMAGQQMNLNEQRAVANPNITAQQRQQLYNAQQQRAQQQQQAAQALQQQTVRANTQAKAQQMGLQGQIGGMGPGPPNPHQPSPAMATLNAPLTRTPGQMNQPEVAQINPNVQFGQSLDPRFSQGNQRAMQAAIISTMSQDMQAKLATFPPERVNEVVMQWHQRQRQQQNGQPGRPQMQANNHMRPGPQVPQEGPQNALGQFMMANPGRQPPPQLMSGMNAQQQLIIQQQIGRMNPNHLQQRNANGIPMNSQAAQHMDQMDIPQQALAHPNMPRNMPQEIKKWGALKHWVQQSGGLAPESLANVINLQKAHYNQQLRARNAANQMAAGGMPAGGPGAPGSLPPGIAPMANMGNQMMSGLNVPQPGVPQVTAQEIQNARISAPQLANASDDQIRNQIMRNRFSNHQQQQQRQSQLMQQQQLQMAQMAQMNKQQPRPGMPGQLQQSGGQNVPGQMQQPKQPPQAMDSAPPAANRANRPPTVGRGNPANSSPVEPPKNHLKRQSSEDVVEVPNPNPLVPQRSTAQQNPGLKAPSQLATPQPPRPQQLTPEQIQKLDPEARKKYEIGVRMFQQSQQNSNPTSSSMIKLRQIASEENARGQSTPMPDLAMNSTTKASIQASLLTVIKPLRGMTQAITKWYEAFHDDVRARDFFRMSYRIRKQYHDEGQYQQMKDTFSITPAEIEAARRVLITMIEDLSNIMPKKMKRPDAPQSDTATTSAQTPPQAGPNPTIPLNAANLQQQQKQLMSHQKAPGRSANAPAAPTSTQPPFPFGGASSPHGTPAYGNGKQSVTQADLKIPPRKKPKTSNNIPVDLGTPGSMASPRVSKTVSPEMKRQNIVDAKQQAKPLLCCSEPDCDRHKVGFESEEALKVHREEEHIKPLSNPFKFAQENLAAVLGLDSDGNQKVPTTGERMVQSDSRQGQTPNIKAGTPMSRQDSMIRQGSSTGKLSTKPQTEAAKPPASTQPAMIADPWAISTIDPQELFATFQGLETGAGGTSSEMNVYRSITPNESPESNSTAVTDTSDISDGVNLDISLDLSFDDNWMPFGGSDVNGLADLNNFDFGNEDLSLPLEDDQPMANYMSWDDMQQEFNKPFEFDTSMYLMNPGQ